jgi:hypothetical protein
MEFVDEGEPAGNYTGSGEVDDQHCWQEMPTGSETEVVVDNSEALSDGLQWQANEEVQVDNQSEPVNAKFNTPENSVSAGISSTPDWSSNQPLRFRNLNEIYDNSEEVELRDSGVELVDSDVEALLIEADEPTKYSEAACHQEWIEAMNKEIQSIEKNRTWELVKLPAGKRPIGVKWVYKLKRNSDGEVVKHKARLVAKGYVQKQGIDFEEAFAPIARLDTVRLLLGFAANKGWKVHHLDIKSAFLHGELEEEVYVSQPEGYTVKGKEQLVLKLSKALYGLRQAPRAWNVGLDKSLRNLNFRRCLSEQAFYTRGTGEDAIIIGVYVDDLIVTGGNPKEIDAFKKQMMTEFEMTDLGLLSYYLGLEVEQKADSITIKQGSYAKKVLEQFGMVSAILPNSQWNLAVN